MRRKSKEREVIKSFPVQSDVSLRLLLLLWLLWSDAIKDTQERRMAADRLRKDPSEVGGYMVRIYAVVPEYPEFMTSLPSLQAGLCVASNMTGPVFSPYCLAAL